jgi:two-component system, OmpR family, sensor histidine kinase KdpD
MYTPLSKASFRFGLQVLRALTGVALVAAITWTAFSVLHVNALIVGFAYVLAVLVIAAQWGLTESLITSVAAMLCLNYFFLPPILSLTIADPQNWVALFAFFATSVTASKLSASVRSRAAEAQARRIEVDHLYELSLSLMLIDTRKELGSQLASAIRKHFGFDAVAFCETATGAIHFSGAAETRFEEEMLRAVATTQSSWFVSRKPSTPISMEAMVAPVMLGGRILGSLGAIGSPLSESAVQAIANLAAITLEHAHQQLAFGRIEAARQNERLRSILLDAVAHEFLTPLTSIKSAVTTVRSEYKHESEEDDFLAVVEEETGRLSEMIDEITDMARIEPGKLRIRLRESRIQDLVRSSVDRMRITLTHRPLKVEIPEDIPSVHADTEMAGLALRQLLGNAVKFSPPESTIAIDARQDQGIVTVTVRDQGPGIPRDEMESIFERYYRGKRTRETVAGTGMGLSIAREIIHAHHGKLWAENVPAGGAQFSFTLPVFDAEDRS